MISTAFVQLAVALGLGLLVGLQREWTEAPFAGIRTFALITVLGTACAQLAEPLGGWIVSAGLILVGAMMIVDWHDRAEELKTDPGHTTLIAVLLMFVAGASLVALDLAVGLVIGGGVAVLLQSKRALHDFVHRIGEPEIRAIMQLALIALVVLPVLPNRSFGPYGVLNPFQIWLMVVIICGISVAGYLGFKFYGARAGTLFAGFLGGVISSTATAVSYASQSRKTPSMARRGAVVIMLASTMVFVRVTLEIAVVAPGILRSVLPPILLMMALMAAISAGLFRSTHTEASALELGNDPADLKSAITFGALYAAVLLAVAIAREHFGNPGLFLVAGLSGLTDMDAITLSTAKLIQSGRLEVDTGWRMILVGAMSNLVFKGAAVAVLGDRKLLARVAATFGLALAGGVAILLLWPGTG